MTRLEPGDEVLGIGRARSPSSRLHPRTSSPLKPSKLTFEQAAAVPVSGLTALQGLCDVGRLQAGQRVLVIGASGGVGTYAVQIAKAAKTQDGGSASTDSSEGSSCRRSSGSD